MPRPAGRSPPPVVTALLAKQGVEGDATIETPIVEKARGGVSIEQRIAVKAGARSRLELLA